MSNKTYNILKWIAIIFLPALGTLYYALAGIWGLPKGEQVVGTIMAVDTFLGIILGISSAQYHKYNPDTDGTLQIDTTDPNKDLYKLILNTPLDDINDKDKIKLKISHDHLDIDEIK